MSTWLVSLWRIQTTVVVVVVSRECSDQSTTTQPTPSHTTTLAVAKSTCTLRIPDIRVEQNLWRTTNDNFRGAGALIPFETATSNFNDVMILQNAGFNQLLPLIYITLINTILQYSFSLSYILEALLCVRIYFKKSWLCDAKLSVILDKSRWPVVFNANILIVDMSTIACDVTFM